MLFLNYSMKSYLDSPDNKAEASLESLTSMKVLNNTYKLNPVSTIKLEYSRSSSLEGSGSLAK